MEVNASGVVYAGDTWERLAGSLSDGDIRRTVLRGSDIQTPIVQIAHRDSLFSKSKNIEFNAQLMKERQMRSIPILNKNNAM